MPLLDNSDKVSLTKTQKKKVATSKIRNLSKESYEELARIQKRGIRLLWKNPDLTPQEIVDGLGEDAAKVFQFHGVITKLITEIAASEGAKPDIDLPTNAFTIEDGVVTISDQPYGS